jgi:large conductance mechanosensitive channel
MLSGFKNFLMRGNVVDLAVGVIIGGAFGAVVASLTKDILMPFIAMIVGKPDFSAIALHIGDTAINVGLFANAIVGFVLVAAAVYFFVVLPVNAMNARLHKPVPTAPPPPMKTCKECLSEIPAAASRCKFCGQPA